MPVRNQKWRVSLWPSMYLELHLLMTYRHTAWAGAASIEGGVVIDLSRLNQIDLSQDRSYVSVGPGNRWGAVYNKLERLGVAVSGGRWADVGVGGLLTGGQLLVNFNSNLH